jgi:hypothetical protein
MPLVPLSTRANPFATHEPSRPAPPLSSRLSPSPLPFSSNGTSMFTTHSLIESTVRYPFSSPNTFRPVLRLGFEEQPSLFWVLFTLHPLLLSVSSVVVILLLSRLI